MQNYLMFLLLSTILACKSTSKDTPSSETKAKEKISLYDSDRIVKIEITSADFEQLRQQEPKGGRCVWGFIGDQYDWFSFDELKIDGVVIKKVGGKKKSWCNSESKTKPSLNIKFDKFDPANEDVGKGNWGTDALTLNNSIQDRSYVRQCLSYELFAKAGIPSPRCVFAEVWVNGGNYGVYVNLEPMKKSFIKKAYGEPLGNLYEIGGEAFESWALARFKANLEGWKDESLEDVKLLIETLKSDQSEDLAALQKVVNFDQFLSYWAMEIILTHWDGMTLGTNNSYMYFKDGKMEMLPWGTDQILLRTGSREAGQVYAANGLAKKIYASTMWKARLEQRIAQLMGEIWKEEAIVTRIDEMADIVRPSLLADEKSKFESELTSLKNNVKQRRLQVASFIKLSDAPQAFAKPEQKVYPKCTKEGLSQGEQVFTYLPSMPGWGYMQLKSGKGFSCRLKASTGDARLPFCNDACPQDAQSGADWGWCGSAQGFSCLD